MLRKLGVAGVITILLSLVFAGLALALSITVDGDHGTDEWGVDNSETCTIGDPGCSRVVDDPVDVSGPAVPAYDLENAHVTNSPTEMFFSLDFYGNGSGATNTWRRTSSGRPLLTICLDIDDNTTTGGTTVPGNCNGNEAMSGVDFFIEVAGTATSMPLAPDVLAWDGVDFVYQNTGTVGYDNDADAVTEIGVLMTDLGYIEGSGVCPISGSAQPCTGRLAMYYDNGAAPSDDSIPATGTVPFQFGCNLGGTPCSPTSITLTTMSANADAKNTAPLILAGASVACAAIAVFLVRRKRTA